jgi:hypothetical protein
VQVIADLTAEDPTVSGVTLITLDGEVTYFDADTFRRGGAA